MAATRKVEGAPRDKKKHAQSREPTAEEVNHGDTEQIRCVIKKPKKGRHGGNPGKMGNHGGTEEIQGGRGTMKRTERSSETSD
jgi:hypothetical protein